MNGQTLCVTLNASLDKTYYVERLHIGGVARPRMFISQAGGKGNNVARAIHRLGGTTIATGFVGGSSGQTILSGLRSEGINHSFIYIDHGQSRTCLAIVDDSTSESTEILEEGLTVQADDVERFKVSLQDIITEGMLVVFSGSLPKGVDQNDICEMVSLAEQAGAKVIVDSRWRTISAVLQKNTLYAVKPNESEFQEFMSAASDLEPDGSTEYYRHGLKLLYESGIQIPIVTLGAGGAMLFDGKTFTSVRAPKVESVNAVGSGDSFLGGFIYGQSQGASLEQSLSLAIAAGAVNATKASAGMIDREEVFTLAENLVCANL